MTTQEYILFLISLVMAFVLIVGYIGLLAYLYIKTKADGEVLAMLGIFGGAIVMGTSLGFLSALFTELNK